MMRHFPARILGSVLWLAAGLARADNVATNDTRPPLHLSTYQPTQTRDPFGRGPAAAGGGVVVTGFNLQGILWDARKPMAIINDQLVSPHKPVTVPVGSAQVQVKALEITRDKVVLEVGTQRVELRLNTEEGSKPAAK